MAPNFLLHCSDLIQKVFSKPISDHFPNFLASDGIKWGPVPSRSETKWLKVDSFKNLVHRVWNNIIVERTATYRIAFKFKRLKSEIKAWTKELVSRRRGTLMIP